MVIINEDMIGLEIEPIPSIAIIFILFDESLVNDSLLFTFKGVSGSWEQEQLIGVSLLEFIAHALGIEDEFGGQSQHYDC